MTKISKTKEEWKSITEYPQYMVSNLGNVMVLPKPAKSEHGRVNGETNGRPGFILSPRPTFHGHMQVCITNEAGERKMEYVHRLVATTFLKNKKGLNVICHIDDNPANNVVTNLKWGTQKINMNMVKNRKPAAKEKSFSERYEMVMGMFNDNKESYSGKKKELLIEISNSLGISYGYVTALIYSKDNKVKFANLNQNKESQGAI